MQKSKFARGARILVGLLLLLLPMGLLIRQSVNAPPVAAGPPADVEALIVRRSHCTGLVVGPPSEIAAARAKAGCQSLAADEAALRQRYRYNLRAQEWLDAVWVDAPGPAKSPRQ